MNNKTFTVLCKDEFSIKLRTCDKNDLIDLMNWKNKNRKSFFFKEFIDLEMQKKWYLNYLERPNDFMFIIEDEYEKIGCMGFRKLELMIDIYNIILGTEKYQGSGIMSKSLKIMFSFISNKYPNTDITAKVLNDNPALKWYIKNGFKIVDKLSEYSLIRLDNHLVDTIEIVQY